MIQVFDIYSGNTTRLNMCNFFFEGKNMCNFIKSTIVLIIIEANN